MLTVDIPGRDSLTLQDLVLDFNGTLATDGRMPQEVRHCLRQLAPLLRLHVLTADTHGSAAEQCADLPVSLQVVNALQGGQDKLRYVLKLGSQQTVAIGNGQNDAAMLSAAVLGILVLGEEGASSRALLAADVVTASIESALRLLLSPRRLVATLRA